MPAQTKLFVALAAFALTHPVRSEKPESSVAAQCAMALEALESSPPPKRHARILREQRAVGEMITSSVERSSGSLDFDNKATEVLAACLSGNESDASHTLATGHNLVQLPPPYLTGARAAVRKGTCAPTARDYPLEARRQGIEGVVVTEFVVAPSGRVAYARTLAPFVHPLLEAATLDILARCAFEPPSKHHRFTAEFRWQLQ